MPTGVFGYDFSVNGVAQPGSLVRRLSLPNGGYITNTYDAVARLTGTWLKQSDNTVLDSATYGNNAGNQRTTFTNAAGTYVGYSYDNIGQLKVADSSVNTEDRGYTCDKAWNLAYRTNNGALSSFTVDVKNQLVSEAGSSCSYDANGNLVQVSGTWVTGYVYDDENRLVAITNGPAASGPPSESPVAPAQQQPPPANGGWKATFTYDGLGRLRIRNDYYAYSTGYYLTNTTWYIYDGNRVIQERNAANTPTVSYTRGNDLSGSLEGAGGIGGLLARSSGYSAGNWTSHAYYHGDGNGNIMCLVDGNQAVAASYRYDPFGNVISKSGTLADANLYRFSSKEFHVNSGLYYYLYRFYDPNTQRWLNKDPLGDAATELDLHTGREIGAPKGDIEGNLYTFVLNDPLLLVDPYGLYFGGGPPPRLNPPQISPSVGAFCACEAACWLVGPGDDALALAAAGFGGKAAMDRLIKKLGKKAVANLLKKLAASSAAKCAGPIGLVISGGTAAVCACFCAHATGSGGGSSGAPPSGSPPATNAPGAGGH